MTLRLQRKTRQSSDVDKSIENWMGVRMTCHQAIVWIDAQEACILRMDNGLQHELAIHAEGSGASGSSSENVGNGIGISIGDSTGYFHRIARALDIADEILIVGPSVTKMEFAKYMHRNDHAIDPRILGVETVTHCADIQLAALAKLYFTVGGPRRRGNGSGHKMAE